MIIIIIIFSGDLQLRKAKNVFTNFTRGFWSFSTRCQRYKKLCCLRAEDRAIFEELRIRGQGQGFEASRPRPRTSKCVLEDVLETQDVLEYSTSVGKFGFWLLYQVTLQLNYW